MARHVWQTGKDRRLANEVVVRSRLTAVAGAGLADSSLKIAVEMAHPLPFMPRPFAPVIPSFRRRRMVGVDGESPRTERNTLQSP